mmetsp:Transcript_32390/g.102852  ORF Transcript_32390/g.102852 Transcript_32390/m.102852 type:complete len:346 (+) Transcript_32390:44-1081(+)
MASTTLRSVDCTWRQAALTVPLRPTSRPSSPARSPLWPLSHVDGPRELLHAVEEEVALLNDVDVDLTPLVGLVGFDDLTNLVNLARQLPRGDEGRKLGVNEGLRHAELAGHRLQLHRPVRCQELLVGVQPHGPHEVAGVPVEEPIRPDQVNDANEVFVERLVLAIEVGVQEVLQVRGLLDGAQDFGAEHELLPQSWPVERHHRQDDSVEDEVLEFHELEGRERRHDIEEERRRFLPISGAHEVDALIDLQLVATLPITAPLQLLLRPVDLLLGHLHVVEEERDADLREDIVQSPTHADGLREGNIVRLASLLLVADAVEELSLCYQPVSDLDVAEVLLGVLDFIL